MRLTLIAAALVATTLLAPAAQAQSKKDLIAKIIALQKPQFEQFGNNLASAPVQQLVPQAAQVLRTKVPEDKRDAVGKAMDAELRAYFDEVSPKLRASAAKNAAELMAPKLEGFSEAELKQLISFMESPVVKRYNQVSAEVPPQLAQKVGGEHRALIESRYRQLEAKLADLLGLKAGTAPAGGASKP